MTPALSAVAGPAVAAALPDDPSVPPAKASDHIDSKAPAAGVSSEPKARLISIEQKPAVAVAVPEPDGAQIRLLPVAPPLGPAAPPVAPPAAPPAAPPVAPPAAPPAAPPLPSPARLPAHRLLIGASSGAMILDQLLALSRSIRGARHYVGYSAFVLFGLRFEVRPLVWEGSSRIDLFEALAPWAVGRCKGHCAVDAVVCCMVPRSGGYAEMVPVSEEHPLSECRHFVSCTNIGMELSVPGTSIENFHQRLGQAILGTVTDGDCGLDVMSQMIGRPQTLASRTALREELAEFMVPRIKLPRM